MKTIEREDIGGTVRLFPRKKLVMTHPLVVPGEELPKVMYALSEAEAFTNDRIMIVGGGDSAIEAALALSAQPGNRVTISYRQDKFGRIKPANRERITKAITRGDVEVLWKTKVEEITPTEVRCRDEAGAEKVVANGTTLIFAGGELPTAFLKSCGVQIDTKFGAPR